MTYFRVIAVAVFLLCLGFDSAFADLNQLAKELYSTARAADPMNSAHASTSALSKVHCTINSAVQEALDGRPKQFTADLATAEEQLLTVSKALFALAGARRYQKAVNVVGLRLASRTIDVENIRTGDDVLRAIAMLAEQSGNAIQKMQTGDAGESTLALLVQNSSDISQLILAFYFSLPS